MAWTGRLTGRSTDGSAQALIDYAGCTYRQFDYWCRAGVFGEAQSGMGSGVHRNGLTEMDMRMARFLTRLTEAGFGRMQGWTIQRVAAMVRPSLAEPRLSVAVWLSERVQVYVDMMERE